MVLACRRQICCRKDLCLLHSAILPPRVSPRTVLEPSTCFGPYNRPLSIAGCLICCGTQNCHWLPVKNAFARWPYYSSVYLRENRSTLRFICGGIHCVMAGIMGTRTETEAARMNGCRMCCLRP